MNSLSLLPAVSGGESCSFVSGSYIKLRKTFLGADLQRNPFNAISGTCFKHMGQSSHRNDSKFCVTARVKKGQQHEYPWPDKIDPNLKSGHLSFLSHFKPLPEKPKAVTLDFEKPLIELEKKILDVRKMADETGLDFSEQINHLESKYQQALKDLYTHLTPHQRLSIARHPNRPTFLDHVLNITETWVELHGDRAGYDDPAIVTGLGRINGKTYMFIGHQKGRNTKENIQRNFGMPTPHGYRKALRMMKYADHHGFPIITFIDTPGAFADLKSEELGQGEAIAHNLRTMFGLKVPIVTVVIGEGGSGGALAIGCGNKMFMLENAVFYVASPEACGAILWKSAAAAPKAAEKLRITATELCKFKIADGIIPEPLGGAHTDPSWTSQQIKLMLTQAMEELSEMDTESLLDHRYQKFRSIGGFGEGEPVEPEKKRNMKKKEAGVSHVTADIEKEIENLSKAILENGKAPLPSISDEAIEKLREEVDKEFTAAAISMGLQDKLADIRMELSKSPDQDISPALMEKVERLEEEFNLKLSRPGSYMGLKHKLEMLSKVNRLREKIAKGEKLKKEINERLQEQMKGKVEILRKAREKVAKGELLDEDEKKEVADVKIEMMEMLKSMNLEVALPVQKEFAEELIPGLESKLATVSDVMREEIEKAIDKLGLRSKIDELKAEIASGSSRDKVEKLYKEIREEIAAAMDVTELKKAQAAVGLPVQETAAAGSLGAPEGEGEDAAELPSQETVGAGSPVAPEVEDGSAAELPVQENIWS